MSVKGKPQIRRSVTALRHVFVLCLFSCAHAQDLMGPPVLLERSGITLAVESDALQRQYELLSAMPSVEIAYAPTGSIKRLRGNTGIFLDASARRLTGGQPATAIFEHLADIMLAGGDELLTVQLNKDKGTGSRNIHLDQSIRGIPVLHGGLVIVVNDTTGLLEDVGGRFLPDRGLPRNPQLSAAEASRIAVKVVRQQFMAKVGSVSADTNPTLAYFGGFPPAADPHLLWVVNVSFRDSDDTSTAQAVWIDAIDGSYVGSEPLTSAALSRTMYTANNSAPNYLAFPNGLTPLNSTQVQADSDALNAYNNAETAYNAWWAVFQQDSLPLGLAVHYTFPYPNAQHARIGGVEYLMFANAMPAWLAIPTGNSLDVVAHEFGHGIVQTLARLFLGDNINDPVGEAQPAALNEAFSDFSTVLVDVHNRGGIPVSATWEIAEIFAVAPYALRSWSVPLLTNVTSRDWFPERSLGRAGASKHPNATIMGHAYKLLVSGGYHYRAGTPTNYGETIPYVYVPSIGHEKARTIFYWAFQSAEMRDFGNFSNAQHATEQEALTRYGEFERQAVRSAWNAVGLGYGCAAPPPMPDLQIENLFCAGRYFISWNAVPGATKFNMERVPAGWTWANATTITDAYVHECNEQVSSTYRYRLRACNGCGCSQWTPAVTLQYYPICY